MRERAVPVELAAAAGFRSVTRDEAASLLELESVPGGGIAIPYYDARPSLREGARSIPGHRREEEHDADPLPRPAGYRIRILDQNALPDSPRFMCRKGDARPYFPPSVPDSSWRSNDVTLVLAEGPVKALALSGIGEAAIGLAGANAGGHDSIQWRASKVLALHPDLLARLTLQGRKVVILFDAGRLTNPMVAYGEAMLARALLNHGSDVWIASLPLRNGRDQGPDDFLHSQGVDALRQIVANAYHADPLGLARNTAQQPKESRGAAAERLLNSLPFLAALTLAKAETRDVIAHELKRAGITKTTIDECVRVFRASLGSSEHKPNEKYRASEARISAARVDRSSGEVSWVPLSNFDARVVEDLERDDGAEKQRQFRLQISFADGRKLTAVIKASAFATMEWVLPAGGADAIVSAGPGARDQLREAIQALSTPIRRSVLAHTGWRLDGAWRYVHAGGVVGFGSCAVELDPPLDRLRLPDRTENLVDAVAVSVALLRCGPASVTVPIFAAVYLAPLSIFRRPNFVLWLSGPSGSLKSSVLALAQSHFGAVDCSSLLTSWESTANAIEELFFLAKDMVVGLDDYAPRKSAVGQRELEQKAQRVVRSVGNIQGRGRMRADTTLRPVRPPRCMVISTGEDLPHGESINARLVVVDVDRATLNLPLLTEIQSRNHLLPHALRGYIEWLYPQMESLRSVVPDAFRTVHELALRSSTGHLRLAEGVAHLYLGLDLGLRFATESGVLSVNEADAWREEGWKALVACASKQGARVVDEDPASIFLHTLSTQISQGRAVLVDRQQSLSVATGPGTYGVGWRDAAYAFLHPEAAREAIARSLSVTDGASVPSARAIGEALARSGLLVTDDGRHQKQIRCGVNLQDRVRVFQVPLTALGIPQATTMAVTGNVTPIHRTRDEEPA